MATFPAPIDETSLFKLCNKFSHLQRHKITSEYLDAQRFRSAADFFGRLHRRVMWHLKLILCDIERTMKHTEDVNVSVVFYQIGNSVMAK